MEKMPNPTVVDKYGVEHGFYFHEYTHNYLIEIVILYVLSDILRTFANRTLRSLVFIEEYPNGPVIPCYRFSAKSFFKCVKEFDLKLVDERYQNLYNIVYNDVLDIPANFAFSKIKVEEFLALYNHHQQILDDNMMRRYLIKLTKLYYKLDRKNKIFKPTPLFIKNTGDSDTDFQVFVPYDYNDFTTPLSAKGNNELHHNGNLIQIKRIFDKRSIKISRSANKKTIMQDYVFYSDASNPAFRELYTRVPVKQSKYNRCKDYHKKEKRILQDSIEQLKAYYKNFCKLKSKIKFKNGKIFIRINYIF